MCWPKEFTSQLLDKLFQAQDVSYQKKSPGVIVGHSVFWLYFFGGDLHSGDYIYITKIWVLKNLASFKLGALLIFSVFQSDFASRYYGR